MNAAQWTVVLCGTEGAINLGLICRTCANLGITDLRLVAPVCAIDCAESRMFANHAQNLLYSARVFPDLPSAVADCDWVLATSGRRRRDTMPIYDPFAVPAAITARGAASVALVFGAESTGLSQAQLRACNAAITLQTPGPYDSYNLAQAVAITLYILCTRDRTDAASVESQATHPQLERLFTYWLSTLQDAGYFRRTDAARFAPKLRRLLQRWNMRPHDVHTLWGMLAHLRGVLTSAREKSLANTRNAVR